MGSMTYYSNRPPSSDVSIIAKNRGLVAHGDFSQSSTTLWYSTDTRTPSLLLQYVRVRATILLYAKEKRRHRTNQYEVRYKSSCWEKLRFTKF
jgi:hypothetical protein